MFLKFKNLFIVLIIFSLCFISCANYKDNLEKVNNQLDKIEKEIDKTEKELDKTEKSVENLKDKLKEKSTELSDFIKSLKENKNSKTK